MATSLNFNDDDYNDNIEYTFANSNSTFINDNPGITLNSNAVDLLTNAFEDFEQDSENIDLARLIIDNVTRSISTNSQSSLSSNPNELSLEIELRFIGNNQENEDLLIQNFILKKHRHNAKSDTYNYIC